MSDAGPAARDRLLTIGAFARRSRLSVKALRLYDRSGLLRPAHVDPATGYRRYRESQLLRARLIVMMRRVGIPLAQVAEIISAPGPAGADLLAAYWADVESRFEVQRELVSRLRTSLVSGTSTGAGHDYDVRERDVAGQLVLAEKRALRITGLKKWLPDVLCRLAETAGRHGGLDGDLFVIFHGEVNEDSDGPVEACAPVSRSAVLMPDMVVRHEAAHREAYVTVTRAQLEFPQILSAYDAVADWIGTVGLSVAGPPREVYPRGVDVAAAAPGDPVCQIAYPICAAGGQVLATSVRTSYVATGLPLELTTSASHRTSP